METSRGSLYQHQRSSRYYLDERSRVQTCMLPFMICETQYQHCHSFLHQLSRVTQGKEQGIASSSCINYTPFPEKSNSAECISELPAHAEAHTRFR
jgi:hypothetical protein